MSATMEERLNELLAMSRDVGRLVREVAYGEQVLASGVVRSSDDKRRHRTHLRELRKEYQQTADSLARGRARFLAGLPSVDGAAS